jgi:RNA polymerase sigma-70 factor (ECF subfamily)
VDDGQLLDRARRGDEAAFSDLYARYQGRVFRYAMHMCGREAGDDLVQETFLALLRPGGRYDPTRGPLDAYVLGIARHLIARHLASSYEYRYECDLDERAGGVEAAGECDVLEHLTREETIETVRAAVRSLPPPFREAVVLCDLQDLDYATAAAIVGCPMGTIRSRLHRARALLLTRLAALQPATSCARKG